jgi:hypothetical protein
VYSAIASVIESISRNDVHGETLRSDMMLRRTPPSVMLGRVLCETVNAVEKQPNALHHHATVDNHWAHIAP